MDLSQNADSHGPESGIFCEICLEFSGEQTDVYGYCTDCKEYLCKNCCEYHCQPKPSRDHKLVYKGDMPEFNTNYKTQSVSGFICPKMCEAHPDMPVLLYCEVHRKQICKLCASIMHVSCYTREILGKETRFLSNLKVQRTFSAFDEVLKTCNGNLATAQHFSVNNDRRLTKTLDSVHKLTTILHSQIDGAMNDLVLKVKKVHEENKAQIDAMELTSKRAKSEAADLKRYLQTLVNEKQYSQLYSAVQHSTDTTNVLQQTLKGINICERFKEFQCKVDRRLYDLIENPQVFILVKDKGEEQMLPMYRQLEIPYETFPAEYAEGRIASNYETLDPKKNNTVAYDYVYSLLSPERKS